MGIFHRLALEPDHLRCAAAMASLVSLLDCSTRDSICRVKSVFSTIVGLAFRMRKKASRHRAESSAGKFGTIRSLNWTGQSACQCSAPNGGGQLAKKSRLEMSSPKAPRATLLGFPWKPANVYLPRSTMHPWRCIHNGIEVASRMARTCRSIFDSLRRSLCEQRKGENQKAQERADESPASPAGLFRRSRRQLPAAKSRRWCDRPAPRWDGRA